MHLRLIAVGDRQPGWVATAFSDYAGRLPRAFRFTLRELPVSKRRRQNDIRGAIDDECDRILKELKPDETVIMLDERGKQLSTSELAARLDGWQADGRDLCFVIGGPDGMHETCLARGNFRWSLSKLTLPHGLARVLCVEQLYRAASLNAGHPYHRP